MVRRQAGSGRATTELDARLRDEDVRDTFRELSRDRKRREQPAITQRALLDVLGINVQILEDLNVLLARFLTLYTKSRRIRCRLKAQTNNPSRWKGQGKEQH